MTSQSLIDILYFVNIIIINIHIERLAMRSTTLIVKSFRDIPRAEKLLLTGLSASFLVTCFATPVVGAVLAFGTIYGYGCKWKPHQNKLVREFYETGIYNCDVYNRPKRELEIHNEVSTFSGDKNAYPKLGMGQGDALHNACVLEHIQGIVRNELVSSLNLK